MQVVVNILWPSSFWCFVMAVIVPLPPLVWCVLNHILLIMRLLYDLRRVKRIDDRSNIVDVFNIHCIHRDIG